MSGYTIAIIYITTIFEGIEILGKLKFPEFPR